MFEPGHKKIEGSGRQKGTPNKVSLELFNTFLETLEEVEEEEKKTFFKYIIKEAFRDPRIGLGILKKLLPDKIYSELEFSGEGIVRKVEFTLIDTPENTPKVQKSAKQGEHAISEEKTLK